MKINSHHSEQGVAIEIIPLIDIIFCILIFFILAALQLTRQQAINVELPGAGTATIQNREMLMVREETLGKVYVDKSLVTESQLYLNSEGYNRTNPEGLLVLYADRGAVYDDVVRVLDLMRSVGGRRVALATVAPGAAEADEPEAPALFPLDLQPGPDSFAPGNPLPPDGADPFSGTTDFGLPNLNGTGGLESGAVGPGDEE
ncbi:MAG: ExbD/TolR family protein [Prochlorothrix sp.]